MDAWNRALLEDAAKASSAHSSVLLRIAFSALPKFARYVNVVWASSWTPPPPKFETVHINRRTLLHRNFVVHSTTLPAHQSTNVLLHHSSTIFYDSSFSISISHDLVIYTTLIICHICPDTVPPFRLSTLEVLPLPGPCLLGGPLWSHLEVRSCLNGALPIYCGSLRNLFGYKLWHTLDGFANCQDFFWTLH